MIKGYQAELMDMYEKTRTEENRKLAKRREEIKNKYPEILELDTTIQKLCLNLSMAALKGITDPNDLNNIRDEITDLLGIRVIHIFKEDWEEIHDFITKMWNVNEIVANVREGDNTKKFEALGIAVRSRISGYRSVHYVIESYPTNQKIIAEVQVRTIFEEGYGEIDHQLRYSHDEIPEVLQLNLLLLNRIAGSSDEMASLINMINKSFEDIKEGYEEKLSEKDKEILKLKEKISNSENINKEDLLRTIDNIIIK